MIPRPARWRPRLLGSALAGALLYGLLPDLWPVTTRLLCAWDLGVVLYLAAALVLASGSSLVQMRQRADEEDDGAIAVLSLTLTAAVVSLGAIGVELHGIHDAPASQQIVRLAVAGVTILCSWFFVQAIYAIHYAHEFYGDGGERRGLAFPQENEPDYWDFFYFSFTMGAASQTSDVAVVSRRMRRLVLVHTVLAFLFNTTVLALAINVGAGLI